MRAGPARRLRPRRGRPLPPPTGGAAGEPSERCSSASALRDGDFRQAARPLGSLPAVAVSRFVAARASPPPLFAGAAPPHESPVRAPDAAPLHESPALALGAVRTPDAAR